MALGRVRSFQDHLGLGDVELDDGAVLPFHCTAIDDGSRHIDIGARVSCTPQPGHLGRMEARHIVVIVPSPGVPSTPSAADPSWT